MRRADFPTARVEVSGAAGRLEQLGATAKHRAALVGRAGLSVLRGLITASFSIGILAWISMHASTPHHYDVKMPQLTYQLPHYDFDAQMRLLDQLQRERVQLQHEHR